MLALSLGVRAASAQTYVVVVAGVGGDSHYATLFANWGASVTRAARSRWGVPEANVTFLAQHPEGRPEASGPATKERLEATLREIAARVEPSADVVIVLFGHGSDRGQDPRFNLVGPDVSAAELGGWLSGITARHIVVVNAASASGGFVPALAGPGRIVVTATKSQYERNATLFGEYFARALADSSAGADTDKDGRLSVLEAFEYARREVARVFEQDKRLLTEHAVLDDDGDGKGTSEPSAMGSDGSLAAAVFLGRRSAETAAAAGDPELQRLYARRDSLEQRVAELRATKGSLSTEAYERLLEDTLVELASTNRVIRQREGRP